jgi:glutaredoxin
VKRNASVARSLATLRRSVLALLLASLTLPAAALYKVVGPDGRVTYTDRPLTDTGARVTHMGRDGASEAPAQNVLPPDLRQTSVRYPVTLYSAADCAPCDAGRQLLVLRGVPFAEKRSVSDDDAAALERLVGNRTVPSLTIGAQVLRGLSEAEWNAYLDAAGYPRESRLPRDYPQAAATPLVERRVRAPAAVAPASAPNLLPMPADPALPPASGLRF